MMLEKYLKDIEYSTDTDHCHIDTTRGAYCNATIVDFDDSSILVKYEHGKILLNLDHVISIEVTLKKITKVYLWQSICEALCLFFITFYVTSSVKKMSSGLSISK